MIETFEIFQNGCNLIMNNKLSGAVIQYNIITLYRIYILYKNIYIYICNYFIVSFRDLRDLYYQISFHEPDDRRKILNYTFR